MAAGYSCISAYSVPCTRIGAVGRTSRGAYHFYGRNSSSIGLHRVLIIGLALFTREVLHQDDAPNLFMCEVHSVQERGEGNVLASHLTSRGVAWRV